MGGEEKNDTCHHLQHMEAHSIQKSPETPQKNLTSSALRRVFGADAPFFTELIECRMMLNKL